MSDVDWNAKAIVHMRSDGGSEMFVDFVQLREGTLAAMVRSVAELPVEERARIIMDVSGKGNLDIGQIMALAARPDLPAA
jgi:hypothetical protein